MASRPLSAASARYPIFDSTLGMRFWLITLSSAVRIRNGVNRAGFRMIVAAASGGRFFQFFLQDQVFSNFKT
jgi:hypothetical protein